MKFTKAFEGKRLINHVIRIVDVMDMEFCGAMCFMEDNCVSYNVMTRDGIGVQKCELNNATHEGQENDLEDNNDYVYNGAEVRIRFSFKFGMVLHLNGFSV